MVRRLLLGRFTHPLLFSYQRTGLELQSCRNDDNRSDKCVQVSICEQRSKNHYYKYHTAPSSQHHVKAPLNGGVSPAIVKHGMFDVLKSGSTTLTSQLATKCVRMNVLHEHVCTLNSSSRPGMGWSQFRDNRITKTNCSHRENVCV